MEFYYFGSLVFIFVFFENFAHIITMKIYFVFICKLKQVINSGSLSTGFSTLCMSIWKDI